jgi:hypothetical protein
VNLLLHPLLNTAMLRHLLHPILDHCHHHHHHHHHHLLLLLLLLLLRIHQIVEVLRIR